MSMREKLKSKWILLSGLVVVAILAVGGIAWAMGFGSDELRGDDFDRASEAALAHVGEGTVVSADRGDRDDVEAFNVEVLRTDGSEVDVLLDENFEVIAAEDDRAERGGNVDDTGDIGDDGNRDLDDRALSADERRQATAAAIEAVPGTVTDVDASDDMVSGTRAAYEVEVRAEDGREWNVWLDADFSVLEQRRDR